MDFMELTNIFAKLRAVGRAALTVDLENSHSGNLSVRWCDPGGVEHLVITATGAPKGELSPDKICTPVLSGTSFGHFKASTETDIHARILQLPGVSACMHAHTKTTTAVTMDDAPRPKSNPRPDFVPLDALGIRYLGRVGVDWFRVPSGSPEMVELLPQRLQHAPATIIQEHGAIAAGASLEEAFFYLCLLEHSGQIAFYAEMINTDTAGPRRRFEERRSLLLPHLPPYSTALDGRCDFADEPETLETFLTIGFRLFESRYTPFHTGSMSLRTASTILYASKASMPHDLPGPLLEVPLAPDGQADPELALHRELYLATPFKALIHAWPAEAEVMLLVEKEKDGSEVRRIIPIDAEGGFLYPAIPLLPPGTTAAELARALLDYRVVIVEDAGVWSAGEQALSEALRHLSSLKDICLYRILARMRRLNLPMMEPERARSW